jgi:cytochrome c oxidase assembly protein subunit 15
MVLISLAVWLVRLTWQLTPRPVPGALAVLPRITLGLLWLAVAIGTVLTGSGPHAGDNRVPRNGLDGMLLTNLHSGAVYATIAATLLCVALLRSRAALLLAVEVVQAGIGIAQYNLGLPIALVALHLLGASLAIAAATNLALSVCRPLVVPDSQRDRIDSWTASPHPR